MTIQRKETPMSKWYQEKVHKKGSGDKDGLESTDNRAFERQKAGSGEEL